MKIPIDDLPEPQPYTKERLGFIFSHDTTAPVIVTTTPFSTTVRLNREAYTLGTELRDISQVLSKEQVELLVKGKEVRL